MTVKYVALTVDRQLNMVSVVLSVGSSAASSIDQKQVDFQTSN